MRTTLLVARTNAAISQRIGLGGQNSGVVEVPLPVPFWRASVAALRSREECRGKSSCLGSVFEPHLSCNSRGKCHMFAQAEELT
jgi:hypothetical protein